MLSNFAVAARRTICLPRNLAKTVHNNEKITALIINMSRATTEGVTAGLRKIRSAAETTENEEDEVLEERIEPDNTQCEPVAVQPASEKACPPNVVTKSGENPPSPKCEAAPAPKCEKAPAKCEKPPSPKCEKSPVAKCEKAAPKCPEKVAPKCPEKAPAPKSNEQACATKCPEPPLPPTCADKCPTPPKSGEKSPGKTRGRQGKESQQSGGGEGAVGGGTPKASKKMDVKDMGKGNAEASKGVKLGDMRGKGKGNTSTNGSKMTKAPSGSGLDLSSEDQACMDMFGECSQGPPELVHRYRLLVARHIEKVRAIYSQELRPLFAWLYDELPRVNTLERYIASGRIPDDLKPASGLLLSKAYGDLVLEWIQKQVPLHLKWKTQLFNEDNFDPRQELFDMIANFFASTALSYMKICMCNNDQHPNRSESEINNFMLQVLRCLSYMDKPDLLKSLEDSEGASQIPGDAFPGGLSQRLAACADENSGKEKMPNDHIQATAAAFMDEPDENLPPFEEFYGHYELALFRKVWEENAPLKEFKIAPEELICEISDDDFPSSEYLITKISDVLDVLVEMINFELYTTHDRTFLLNAFAVKGLAAQNIVNVICGRYENEQTSVLELWEGIFARVYQTLYPDDVDASSDDDSDSEEEYVEEARG